MPQDPSDPSRKTFRGDRRAPRGRSGGVRWVKGLLGRSLTLERRGAHLHLTLVDRRRPPEVIEADALKALRAEIRAHLQEHENRHAAAVMRHLVLVLDVLGRKGWAGVGAMASRMLHKAQIQAQMLATERPSRRLSELTSRLNLLQMAASVREDQGLSTPAAPGLDVDTTPLALPPTRATSARPEMDTQVEVSIGSPDEFEAIRRSWMDTVSPAHGVDADAAAEPAQTADDKPRQGD